MCGLKHVRSLHTLAESGLIVVVPEAEPLVSDLRLQYDESARLGVPAHITVLYPFMAPSMISAEIIQQCTRCVRSFARFAFTIGSIGRFPAACYLEPTPAEPFIQLTHALWGEFPQFPPYGGVFPSVVPHLTIADGNAQNAAIANAAVSSALASFGPVQSACSEVVLMENSSGRWEHMHAFPLMNHAET